MNGRDVIEDGEGQELADMAAAGREAGQSAREHLAGAAKKAIDTAVGSVTKQRFPLTRLRAWHCASLLARGGFPRSI
jgi:hypothetical protein